MNLMLFDNGSIGSRKNVPGKKAPLENCPPEIFLGIFSYL